MKSIKSLVDKKYNCCGCSACAQVCAKRAIQMQSDNEGFLYPSVNDALCNECGRCLQVCPVLNKVVSDEYPEAYAVKNKSEEVIKKSSSGGAFSALADIVLNNGGVVFGAALSDDCHKVSHICVKNANSLDEIRGSKYVQSDIGDSYKEAKRILELGNTVLFAGTPCEIAGLKSFLNKDYCNLYTCDLICHGSPSPLVWDKYLTCKETNANAKAVGVSFRNKTFGWKKYSLKILFDNGTEYINSLDKDAYLRGFISNIYLRPSCHKCSFKGVYKSCDFTLADFWGAENLLPDEDASNGISLVLVHTRKGKELLNGCACDITKVDCRKALSGNTGIVTSASAHPQRTKFFKKLNTTSDVESIIFSTLSHINYKRLCVIAKNKVKKLLKF